MAVRKIPLKARPYLTDNAIEPNSVEVRQLSSEEGINGSRRPSDPAVQKILALIRKRVLSDRALHDQVGIVMWFGVRNHSYLLSVPSVFRAPRHSYRLSRHILNMRLRIFSGSKSWI